MTLSKDDTIRVGNNSKKLSKGYNGYIVLLIQLIYNSSNEIKELLSSKEEWTKFLNEFYEPYTEKFALELGGYHPRTKKEANSKIDPEEEELTFLYNQDIKPLGTASTVNKFESYKPLDWLGGENGFNKNFSDFEEIYNEYDDYYEDRKYSNISETKENNEYNQNLTHNQVKNEEKMQIEENGRMLPEKIITTAEMDYYQYNYMN